MGIKATYGIWARLAVVPLFSLLLGACTLRTITYDYYPFYDVDVNADWSSLSKEPSGMTMIFYPQNGGAPMSHSTNSVNSTVVPLKAGTYNVIIFNQSPSEFGSLGFRGLESYGSMEIYAREMESKSLSVSKAGGGKLAIEPEEIAVATIEDLVISEESGLSITIAPEKATVTGKVRILVDGIVNARAVQASISGMAEGFSPSISSATAAVVTHSLENWGIVRLEEGYSDGYLKTEFATFGLPSESPDTTLDIAVLLVDNKTVMRYSFPLHEHISIREENGELVLIIDLKQTDPKDPASVPMKLPDVVPEGSSSGGFDASVDNWGEEQKVEIELK